jgi:hypothetical protein
VLSVSLRAGASPTTLALRSGAWAFIALAAAITHVPYVLASDCLDSDAAVVTLMGHHFAQGDLSVFLWGSRYMGPLEAWALVPFSWLGVPMGLCCSCIAALALTAIQAICVARIAKRVRGQVFVAVLLVTAAPALTAFAQTTLYGARLAATTLVLVALDTIQGGPGARRAVVSGVFMGLALYGDRLMIVWVLPVALAAYRLRRLGCLLAGALPWVVFERMCFALTTGPKPGVADPWEWPRNIQMLLRDGIPMLVGADWAAARQADFIPPAASAGWVALSLATAASIVCASIWLGRHRRAPEVADLLLVPAATAGLFVLVACDTQSTRYLVPAWPALAILATIAAKSRPAVGVVGALVTAGNMALSVADDTVHAHGRASGSACGDELRVVAKALSEEGVQGVWADYWDVYRLGLAMNEQMPFAPFRGVDRRPAWTRLVRDARPVAYLLTGDRAPSDLRSALDRAAVPRRVGRYDLYLLPQSLPTGAGAVLAP